MSTNVGAIDLDLVLNSNKFNKELNSVQKTASSAGNTISSSLKKIGLVAAAAFSVKKIIDFGKECINLGSDLSEVQNVVDVSFKTMNHQVNEFANSAIENFGLGQTVAKKYIGTFGAMSKAFGFSEKAAYEMSTTLTGLAGDVASFYNLSSDEAYTKLKSVFTGETESLKELGVVMTQTALDQYALTNGYGKTTAKMSEQEKVALRYSFVLKQLETASGDFVRTQDGWANQTRVLSLRFNELKASLGQGFINLFTPIVQGINWVISKLQVLADAFRAFTEMITGKKSESSGMGNVASDLAGITDSADNASNAVGGIGDSASKSAKKMKSLFGFDKANILQSSDSGSSSGGGTGGLSSSIAESINTSMGEANAEMSAFTEKAKELAEIFKEGFSISFGNTNFDGIFEKINGIKNSLISIGKDANVLDSARFWGESFLYSLGQVVGGVSRIGVNIAEGLIGSIDKYLSKNTDRIKRFICNMFDISSEDMALTGNLFQALGEISDVFSGETAQQIGANIIAMFANPFMSAIEVCSKFVKDLRTVLLQPIIDNVDKIKMTLENVMQPIQKITGTLAEAFTYVGDKWNEVYDTYIGPFMESLKTGLSDTFGKLLDAYNEYLVPTLDNMADKFGTLWNDHLRPFVEKVGGFIGSIVSAIQVLWENWLKPLIDWIIDNIIPVVQPILESIWNTICSVFGAIADAVGGIIDTFKGLIDFVVGVFTGDWDKAWEGIKTFFSGIWDAIKGIVSAVWNAITGIVDTAINIVSGVIQGILGAIKAVWENIWNGIKNIVTNIWNAITGTISNVIGGIKNTISNVLNAIKAIWDNIWNGLKTTVTNIFSGVWNTIKGVINSILNGIEKMTNGVINGINGMIRALNKLKFNIPDWVPGLGGKTFGFNIPQINRISIPKLYEGGYFKANQPTLAMVGDNKTQDEIVSPVPKMQDALRAVLREQGTNSEIIKLLQIIIDILKQIGVDVFVSLDNNELTTQIEKQKKKINFATNGGW